MSSKKNRGSQRREIWLPPELQEKYKGHLIDTNDMSDEMKISARLIDLMEPWGDEIDKSILTDCAAIAWNETLKEDFDTVCSARLNNILIDFSKYQELINALKERKRKLFHNDFRIIKGTFLRVAEDGDIKVNVLAEVNLKVLDKVLANKRKDKD